MVARRIFERTPEKWLAAPADQHEMGHLPTQKLALDGCEVGGRGRQPRAHPLHALEIAREAIRHRHGHRTQKAHEDRKSDVAGKSVSVRVDLGGRRYNKKKKKE